MAGTPVSAQSEDTISPALIELIQRYDRAASSGDQETQSDMAAALLNARQELTGFFTEDEIADLYGSMAAALVEQQEPALARRAIELAVEINRSLVERLESGEAISTTLDIYAAREALHARLLVLADFQQRGDGASLTNAALEEAQALYFEHLAPGEISLQTMGAGQAPVEEGSEPFEVVRVFFGTNREATGDDPNSAYSNNRGELSFGVMEVSVPRNRTVGSIPRPSIGGEREGLHIILRSIDRYEGEGFNGDLRAAISGAESEREEIFVYIHGHSVRFEDAARRTAQLAVDLDMRHGGVFYSWPTGNSFAAYQESQNNVPVAARRLARFLETVLAEANGADVHVIAHSMGNRVLLRAMERIYEDPGTPLFAQVFWASPDVDAENFSETLQEMPGIAQGMIAYTSGRDRALQVSRALAGDYPRAGQSEPLPQIAATITAVDTTSLSFGFLGHTDFATSVIEDMQSVVWLSLAPEERCMLALQEIESGASFWRAIDTNPACGRDAFRRAIRSVRFFGDEASTRISAAIASGQVPGEQREDWENARDIATRVEGARR